MPLDTLFQGKKNVFLRNTTNKHHVIIVTLTEPTKPGCNAFHLFDDAAIGTTKLNVQNSLKCLIMELLKPWIYLCCCCNLKPLYFKGNKKLN